MDGGEICRTHHSAITLSSAEILTSQRNIKPADILFQVAVNWDSDLSMMPFCCLLEQAICLPFCVEVALEINNIRHI